MRNEPTSVSSEPITTVSAEHHSVEQEHRAGRTVPVWLLSAVVHGVALGLMSLIVYATQPDIDEPSTKYAYVPTIERPEPVEPPQDPPIPPEPIEMTSEDAVDEPTADPLVEVIEDVASTEEPVTDLAEARGRPDAASSVEMASVHLMPAIGVGSTAPGGYGHRDRGSMRRTNRLYCRPGSPNRLTAIDHALTWFKRHQSPNGQWDVDGYQANCQDAGAKCEPGSDYTGADGDLACTAYAILCYLGAGYDHSVPSKYKRTVQLGLDWLVAQQKADGLWGDRNYEHAIVTMAIAEAYGMSTDPRLRQPAQQGIDVILARQAKDTASGSGLGWDYVAGNAARNDASVSGWNIMALKSARAANLDIGSGLEGSARYLERAWQAANPGVDAKQLDPYRGTSVFPYVWNAETGAVEVEPGGNQHDMSCVGALCAVFLGRTAEDPLLNSLANHINQTQYPTAYPTNTYYLYYNAMVMFQMGGKHFEKWNQPVVELLTKAQRRDACHAGSWDFAGTVFHGNGTGRLLSTAYCCLTLEVIFRWEQIAAGKAH